MFKIFQHVVFLVLFLVFGFATQHVYATGGTTPGGTPAPLTQSGPLGLDWVGDQCLEPPPDAACTLANPFCVRAHPNMRGAVTQALNQLRAQGVDLLNQVDHTQNCGPGLAVELAASIYMQMTNRRVYLLSKNYGRACNGHSEDVIVFPDGCAFDVIGRAGAANAVETMQPLCCGTPPCQTDGCCLPINSPRFMDPPNRP